MNVSVETPRTEFDFEDCREQYMYVRDTKYTIAPHNAVGVEHWRDVM